MPSLVGARIRVQCNGMCGNTLELIAGEGIVPRKFEFLCVKCGEATKYDLLKPRDAKSAGIIPSGQKTLVEEDDEVVESKGGKKK
jgi:hypothetical protein